MKKLRKSNECIQGKAASEEAAIKNLPELCLTGYFIWDDIEEPTESVSGDSFQFLPTKLQGSYHPRQVISSPEERLWA